MAKTKWEDMTREQKRVAVARDVLSLISKGIIEPYQRVYIDISKHCRLAAHEIENCNACALGSLFLSFMAKTGSDKDVVSSNRSDIIREIRSLFDEFDLGMIESAFEMCTMGAVSFIESEIAIKFGRRYDNDDDRLIAIMQNIVDHKGEFRPEVEYEIYYK